MRYCADCRNDCVLIIDKSWFRAHSVTTWCQAEIALWHKLLFSMFLTYFWNRTFPINAHTDGSTSLCHFAHLLTWCHLRSPPQTHVYCVSWEVLSGQDIRACCYESRVSFCNLRGGMLTDVLNINDRINSQVREENQGGLLYSSIITGLKWSNKAVNSCSEWDGWVKHAASHRSKPQSNARYKQVHMDSTCLFNFFCTNNSHGYPLHWMSQFICCHVSRARNISWSSLQ